MNAKIREELEEMELMKRKNAEIDLDIIETLENCTKVIYISKRNINVYVIFDLNSFHQMNVKLTHLIIEVIIKNDLKGEKVITTIIVLLNVNKSHCNVLYKWFHNSFYGTGRQRKEHMHKPFAGYSNSGKEIEVKYIFFYIFHSVYDFTNAERWN